MQCALRYTALDAASRRRVWEDLLAHASIAVDADIDTSALSRHELNGRQIKNALQLAVGELQTDSVRLSESVHAVHANFAITLAISTASASPVALAARIIGVMGFIAMCHTGTPLFRHAALAQHEGAPALAQRHLDATVAITSAFIEDIDSSGGGPGAAAACSS